MLKHMALASFTLLCGCSDFWTSYMVINPDGASVEDGATADGSVTPGCTGDKSYIQTGDTFTTCCYVNNSELSGDNVYRTIQDAQLQGIASPIIVIGCPEPRELPVRSLASGGALGEESALPIIVKKVIINGNGSALNANKKNRHFLVTTQGSLTLNNLTLKNGLATSAPEGASWPLLMASGQRANMACGGSILSGGDVRLVNVLLTANAAQHDMFAAGGAICMGNSLLEMENSIIYDNAANGTGQTGKAKGAAAYLYKGSAKVVFSTILQNTNSSNVTSSAAAAFHFEEAGSSVIGSFASKNSLFVNYFADMYPMQSSTINYAINFSCTLGLTKAMLPSVLSSTAYDDVVIVETCGKTPVPLNSGIGIKWTGRKWLAPAGDLMEISPGAMWDGAFRLKTEKSLCSTYPKDFFGLSRVLSSGQSCMPGAVEPRTN